MRSLIKHKAKHRLQSERFIAHISKPLNEELLLEIAAVLFNQEKLQLFEKACNSREEAAEIEDKMATELVETYQNIESQQSNPIVEKLNALL
ncbi:hypothetical protein [Lyngbya aestuarii]|uniref:hypothetical protein n=1 Tax=Lyngbya aestuarii TaxID=118322 RepID=UPI00403E02FB